MKTHHILVVDDDFSLSMLLRRSLQTEDRVIRTVSTIQAAYQAVKEQLFDLVILDKVLPDGSGLDVAKFLHHQVYTTRVLMLSQERQGEHRIESFEEGADDFLAKPFELRELQLRVDRLLAMYKIGQRPVLRVADMSLDTYSGEVSWAGVNVRLKRREMELLTCLMHHKNAVVSKKQLAQEVWGGTFEPSMATIEVYIRRLRLALGSSSHQKIETLKGFGYRLVESNPSST